MDNNFGYIIFCVTLFFWSVPIESVRCPSSTGTSIYCSTACCGLASDSYCCSRQYKTAMSTSSSGLYYYTYYYKVYYTYYYYTYSSNSSGGFGAGGIGGIIACVLTLAGCGVACRKIWQKRQEANGVKLCECCAPCKKMCCSREEAGEVTFQNGMENQQSAVSTITP